MKPTPRKLALLMSIAGLGLSLGKPAYGRIDADVGATAVAVDTVELPGDGAFNPWAFPSIAPLPVVRSLAGELGDDERAAIRAAVDALGRKDVRGATDPGRRGSAAEGTSRVSDLQYEQADALALVLMEDPQAPAGTPAHPPPPARHQLVTGVRQRDPKSPSTSTKLRPWTSVAGPDPKSDDRADEGRPSPSSSALVAASAAPSATVGPSNVSSSDAENDSPSHAHLSVAELARYLAGPPLDDVPTLVPAASARDGDPAGLSVAAPSSRSRVAQTLSTFDMPIDRPANGRVASDSPRSASAAAPVGIDIDLPLDQPVDILLSGRSAPMSVAETAPRPASWTEMDRMAESLRQVMVAEAAPRQDVRPAASVSPSAATAPAPWAAAAATSTARPAGRLATTPAATAGTASALDLNLAIGPVAALDLNPVVVERGLDIELELTAPAPRLDLNLDLGPRIDMELAGPPDRHRGVDIAVDVDLADAVDFEFDVDVAVDVAAVAMTAPAIDAASNPAASEFACRAPAVSAHRVPRIVVASHGERVLHSLGTLLSSDDASPELADEQSGEVFVSSHAERTLLTLAAALGRDDLFGSSRRSASEDDPASLLAATPGEPAVAAAADRSLSPSGLDRSRARSPIGDGLVAVGEQDLDRVRGGFITGAGLQVSFGIERAVYINGSLVTTTSLNVSDAAGAVRGHAPVNTVASGVASGTGITLIQNGPGNTFLTGPISAATLGTVVQNTLNDQKIQNITSINAAVNSLQVLRGQNLESTLRGALIDSLRR